MKTVYIVWNKEKTDRYCTFDKQLAYEVRKGSMDNCFYGDGHPSHIARAFCEKYGEEDCSIEEIR